jgi:diacylglycerol kinase family enzyme
VSFSLQPDLKGSVKVNMHIVDLLDPDLKKSTLRTIKALQAQPRKLSPKSIVIVTMGGDGTFMFLAQDACREGLVLDDGTIAFCILPFGTGNDLS